MVGLKELANELASLNAKRDAAKELFHQAIGAISVIENMIKAYQALESVAPSVAPVEEAVPVVEEAPTEN